MGSNSPPDGWTLETGTWGTGVDREESTVLTGTAGIVISNAAAVVSVISEPMPVFKQANLSVAVTFQASRASAGDTITIEADHYLTDGTFDNTETVYSGLASATATWLTIGKQLTAQKAFMRLRIKKAAQAFTLIIDRVLVERYAATHAIYYQPTPGTVAMSTLPLSTVPFDTAIADRTSVSPYVSAAPDVANNRILLYEPGVYLVEWGLEGRNFTAGTDWLTALLSVTGGVLTATGINQHITGDVEPANDSLVITTTNTLIVTDTTSTAFVQLLYSVSSAGWWQWASLAVTKLSAP